LDKHVQRWIGADHFARVNHARAPIPWIAEWAVNLQLQRIILRFVEQDLIDKYLHLCNIVPKMKEYKISLSEIFKYKGQNQVEFIRAQVRFGIKYDSYELLMMKRGLSIDKFCEMVKWMNSYHGPVVSDKWTGTMTLSVILECNYPSSGICELIRPSSETIIVCMQINTPREGNRVWHEFIEYHERIHGPIPAQLRSKK